MRWVPRTILRTVLAVCLLSAVAGWAETVPAPSEADAATTEALALVDQQSPEGSLLGGLRERVISALVERGDATPKQAAEATDKIVMPGFKANLPRLKARLARVWTLRFTANELRELLVFLKDDRSPLTQGWFVNSELGRRYLAEKDEIVRESGVEWREWGPPIVQEAFSRHVADLKAIGIDPDNFK